VKIPYLDLSYQTCQVSEEFFTELRSLVDGNQFIGGNRISDFEKTFADYCGTEFCVAVNSGTDALRIALLAVGVGRDDEVITSPFTFIATAEAISQTGRLVLADIDPETYTLDPESVRERINTATRAILPVHIFGLASDMPALQRIANENNLKLVEDACQSHGASIQGRKAGSIGNVGAFSFYPSKNLSAFGDAGAVTCNSPELAEKIFMLRNHGQTGAYIHALEGFNSRMDTIQSTVLTLKMRYLDEWNQWRSDLAGIYRDGLGDIEEIKFQRVPDGYEHAYHIVAFLCEDRDNLSAWLLEKGVDTRVVYPTPLHLMKAYAHLGFEKGSFPVTERVCEQVLCLPVYPGMPKENAQQVVKLIREYYKKA
jgi:dTDP-4-amino-4,6-dideoxygalactose transaminase